MNKKTKKELKLKGQKKYLVPAIAQAAQLLYFLAKSDSSHLSFGEICSGVGIHSSRAYAILKTLEEFGFTQRNIGGKGYSLGTGLITLSRKVLDNLDTPQIAAPILLDLAKKTESTAALLLINNDHLTVVGRYEGGDALGITVRVGHNLHLTHGAEGKVIAAFLPEKELNDLLNQKKTYFYGAHTKVDRARLLKDLEECRQLWYALDIGDYNPAVNAVAAPLLGPARRPLGCITVVGIGSSDKARKIAPQVAKAGKEISRLMGALSD